RAGGPHDRAGIRVNLHRREHCRIAADLCEHRAVHVGIEVDRLLDTLGKAHPNEVVMQDLDVGDVHGLAPTAVARWYRAPRRGWPSPSTSGIVEGDRRGALGTAARGCRGLADVVDQD